MLKHTQEKIGFVFVNGAGLEGRIWSKVVEDLEHPYLLVEFPLRKSACASRSGLTLEDYVTHMIKQVEDWGTRRFVLVAHSLGGVLAHRLASSLADRLAGIVAVGAAIPRDGSSFISLLPLPQKLILSVIMRTSGTKPPESAIRKGLCNDLSPDQAAEIVEGFIPEAIRVYTDRVKVSIPDVPKLYVKLINDQEFGPSLQDKMISNFSPQSVQSLDTGHLPMISDPEGLRSILVNFLAKEVRELSPQII